MSKEWLLFYLTLNKTFLSHLKLLFGRIILEILQWATECDWEQVTHAQEAMWVLKATAWGVGGRGNRRLSPVWEPSHMTGQFCWWAVMVLLHMKTEGELRFFKAGCHRLPVWNACFVFLILALWLQLLLIIDRKGPIQLKSGRSVQDDSS